MDLDYSVDSPYKGLSKHLNRELDRHIYQSSKLFGAEVDLEPGT